MEFKCKCSCVYYAKMNDKMQNFSVSMIETEKKSIVRKVEEQTNQ